MLDDIRVSPTMYTGAPWDELSDPDPIVYVTVQSASGPSAWQDGPDDVYAITYRGTPVLTNVHASDIRSYIRFMVYDEDVFDPDDFVGNCWRMNDESAFSGLVQTTNCALNPDIENSGFTLHWHLVPL